MVDEPIPTLFDPHEQVGDLWTHWTLTLLTYGTC